MKNILISSILLLSALALSSKVYSKTQPPVLEGAYLGQKSPGSIPQAFAPGVISTKGYEYNGIFTPDMNAFYFIRESGTAKQQEFVAFEKKDNQWKETVVSKRIGQHSFSPDGKTMHLGRRYLELTDNGWSDRKMLALPFKDILIMRLTTSKSGTYYFDTWDKAKKDFPIRYSRLVDGKYEQPKPLSKNINTGTQLNHPFIAPDESYIIWDAIRSDGYGDSDLYISYRQKDGTWGKAINLGSAINTNAWDAAGYVTADGKYFFFNRMISSGSADKLPDVDIYWVEAHFIEKLRPKR